jgi:signal transduction histidine kinase
MTSYFKSPQWRDLWSRWKPVFGIYQVFLLVFLAQRIYPAYAMGKMVDTYGLSIDYLVGTLVWGIVTFPILVLTKRFPLDTGRRIRHLAYMSIFSAFFYFLHVTIYLTIYVIISPFVFGPKEGITLEHAIQSLLYFRGLNPTWRLVHLFPLITICYGYEYYQAYIQGVRKTAELQAQLAKAQLQALQMQMAPHFLFNTLNSIYVLVKEDSNSACRMIEHLSALLRITLQKAERQLVPLKEELDYIRLYLAIEQIRFQDRLKVLYEIAPEAMNVPTPNFILQPLVENAIRHGISQSPGEGFLRISAKMENNRLKLSVCDNGPGLSRNGSASSGGGIGLTNIRERLNQIFGVECTLELINLPEGGLCVAIEIPSPPNPRESAEFAYA